MYVYIYIYIYIIRLASNEIFSPSNKLHREVGRTKDLSVCNLEIPCDCNMRSETLRSVKI